MKLTQDRDAFGEMRERFQREQAMSEMFKDATQQLEAMLNEVLVRDYCVIRFLLCLVMC